MGFEDAIMLGLGLHGSELGEIKFSEDNLSIFQCLGHFCVRVSN